MDRRNFLKVGGMSTLALTLGTTGLFSLTNASKSLAAGKVTNPAMDLGLWSSSKGSKRNS